MFGLGIDLDSFELPPQSQPELQEVGIDEDEQGTTTLYKFQDSTRSSVFYRGSRQTGITFGRGGDISVRIYDKTEELRMRMAEAEGVRAARLASEKRDIEAEIWSRHGWQEGEPVTRVEVQVRGTALQELCNRCEVRVENVPAEEKEAALDRAQAESVRLFEESIDGLWQYATRKWLRLIERTRTRRSRCPTHPWWKAVQEVSFFRRTEEPLKRVRKRSAAKSSQVLGAAIGLATLHGLHSPWVDTEGPIWRLKDEKIAAKRIDSEGLTKWRLTWEVGRILDACKDLIVRDMLEQARRPRDAIERLICRWGAATARYQPSELERAAPA